MKKRDDEEVDMNVRILKRIFGECGHMEQTHIFIIALLRVVRNEDYRGFVEGVFRFTHCEIWLWVACMGSGGLKLATDPFAQKLCKMHFVTW
jgi:hypothetical protein